MIADWRWSIRPERPQPVPTFRAHGAVSYSPNQRVWRHPRRPWRAQLPVGPTAKAVMARSLPAAWWARFSNRNSGCPFGFGMRRSFALDGFHASPTGCPSKNRSPRGASCGTAGPLTCARAVGRAPTKRSGGSPNKNRETSDAGAGSAFNCREARRWAAAAAGRGCEFPRSAAFSIIAACFSTRKSLGLGLCKRTTIAVQVCRGNEAPNRDVL